MTKPVRILVLEDDISLRGVLEQVLRSRGFEVVVSSRGDEAIQHARGERFDLIVADIRMDGMNGLDTIEKAKELQPDIGSIVVSGFASEEETLRAVKLNVAGYLKKPFKIDALLDLVNKHVAQRTEQRAKEAMTGDLKRSLLWSLERQGYFGERLFPGQVTPAAELAGQLAKQMGFSGNLPLQLQLATLLRALENLGEFDPPDYLARALEAYPLLQTGLDRGELPEVCAFALAAKEEGTTPEGRAWDPRILEAHARLASQPEDRELEGLTVSGLLSLARTLEHAGDLSGAQQAYREVCALESISPQAVRAKLGEARLAVAQGLTQDLEAAVKRVLDIASVMGPVSLALTQLEAAQTLRRGKHPAAGKLLRLAVTNLSGVHLSFPQARAQLALCAHDPDYREKHLSVILSVMAKPIHRLELLEHLEDVLCDLLESHAESLQTSRQFLTDLILHYPNELLGPLAFGRLDKRARSLVLQVLEESEQSPPPNLLEQLADDPVPELKERALRLAGGETGDSRPSVLRVYTLGALEVSLGGQRLDEKELKTQKTRFLVARLFGNNPRTLSVDRLIDEFWPESAEGGRNNLNTAVSLIRRFLMDPKSQLDPVLRVGESLSVNPELPVWHDVDEFDKASEQANKAVGAGNLEAALPQLKRMVQLYRGPYLESCYMDWALERRTRLEIRLVQALKFLTETLFEQRRYAETLEYGFKLLSLHPDDVEAHEAVMQSLLLLDQHQRAVKHFEAYRDSQEKEGDGEIDLRLEKVYQMAKYGLKPDEGTLFTKM